MMPSDRTKNIKKMMLSSAGVGELAGNEILMRPEKQTGLVTLMPNSASVVNKPQVESSIVIVNEPAAVTMLLTVNATAVGGGEKSPMSNTNPLRVSIKFVTVRRRIWALMVTPVKSTGCWTPAESAAVSVRFQYVCWL